MRLIPAITLLVIGCGGPQSSAIKDRLMKDGFVIESEHKGETGSVINVSTVIEGDMYFGVIDMSGGGDYFVIRTSHKVLNTKQRSYSKQYFKEYDSSKWEFPSGDNPIPASTERKLRDIERRIYLCVTGR